MGSFKKHFDRDSKFYAIVRLFIILRRFNRHFFFVLFTEPLVLEEKTSKLFDKQAALFLPSGVMGNLIASNYAHITVIPAVR